MLGTFGVRVGVAVASGVSVVRGRLVVFVLGRGVGVVMLRCFGIEVIHQSEQRTHVFAHCEKLGGNRSDDETYQFRLSCVLSLATRWFALVCSEFVFVRGIDEAHVSTNRNKLVRAFQTKSSKKSGYRGSRAMKASRANDAVVDNVCGHSAHFARCGGVRDIVVVVD